MTNNFVIGTPKFEWQEINLKGNSSYYISGYISTIDVDDYNEVVPMKAQEILLKACQDRIKSGIPITMDIEHEEFKQADQVLRKPKNTRIPVAKIIDAELREKGVWVKAEINKHGDRFSQVWNSIKEGYLHSFSIAFAPLKKVTQSINGVVQTFIEDLNLTNVTLTGSPVNRNATFTMGLKAKLHEVENMEETEQKPAEVVEEQPKVEEKVEQTDKPSSEEQVITINDLIENAKALEKERVEFESQRAAFEKQKAEYEASQKPAESKETKETVDLVAQIKSEKQKLEQEVAELKAKLNTPILKSKIRSAEDKKIEYEKSQRNMSPLELI